MKSGYVYIMASQRNGTLYLGVTSDLARRVFEHENGLVDGFSKRYNCKLLVWYETHDTITAAIKREKRLKKYSRQWKLNLIEQSNPDWDRLHVIE